MNLSDRAAADLPPVEVEHNTPDTGNSDPVTSTVVGPNWPLRAMLVAIGVVVFGSIGLFATVGKPQQSGQQPQLPLPTELATSETQQQATPAQSTSPQLLDNIEEAIKRLEAKLAVNPNDADGWRVLGWSYYNLERYSDSAEAYRRSSELRKDSAILKSLHGEALVKSTGGRVTADAKNIFEAALVLDPNDVRARYFTGVAIAQAGNAQGAIDTWIGLLKIAPGGADWADELRKRIVTFAANSGIDIGNSLPDAKSKAEPQSVQASKPPRGPSAKDIENAEDMSQQDRMAMVRGMVESLARRLEETPDDPDGWVRLIRSWLVLEETKLAHAALTDAMKVFADRPQIQSRIKNSAKDLGLTLN